MDAVATLVHQALGSGYTVERELSGGGAARVVVARDHRLGRRVVVKVLHSALVTPDRVERFRREIQVALSLQHPHIVPILSAGEAEGVAYLIMPFVEGESLRTRLADGPLGVVEAVRVLRGVALALAYAHGRGVVHRDVKPDNVLLAAGTPMVADFGIAKAIAGARSEDGSTDHTLTVAGTSVGTPTYMAPEQIVASSDTDHRADIYAFGVLAYEILAGVPPFRGPGSRQLFTAHLTEPPPPLWEHRRDVPQALADLVVRCLAKDPAARPASADELAAALESPEIVSGQFAAPSHDPVPAAPRRQPRSRVPPVVGAALAVVLAAALGFAALRGGSGATGVRAMDATPIVAVLPLASVGAGSDSSVAAVVYGEITNALGALPGVRLMGTTGAAALQRRLAMGDAPPPDLAAWVEGAVYRADGELRIAVRVVGADGVTIAAIADDSGAGLREMAADAASRIAAALAPPGSP